MNSNNLRSARAVIWYTRVANYLMTDRRTRRLQRWLAQPENQTAFEAVRATWHHTPFHMAPAPPSRPEPVPELRSHWPWRYAAVATALAASVCAVWLGMFWIRGLNATFESKPGEWRRLTLEDGSVIQALPRTTLEPSLTTQQRYVHLVAGEASFAVAKDTHRPFIVETRDLRAEAVGTRFTVRIVDYTSVVIVSEGIVRVQQRSTKPGLQSSIERMLSAGEKARASRGEPLEIKRADLPRELSWHTGWLVTDADTLGEIVDRFNQVNVVQISIDDPPLAEIRMNGLYRVRVDNPEKFVDLLAAQLGVMVYKEGNRLHVRGVPAAESPR